MAVDYGTDVSALPDLDPMFADVSGRAVLIESLARRYETKRGTLFYDDDYGYDLRELLNEGLTDADLFEIESEIGAEAQKDERVLSSAARVALDAAAQTMTVAIYVSDGAGPFRFVLNVSSVTVALLNEGSNG